MLIGTSTHLPDDDRLAFEVNLMSAEAWDTTAIEGVLLDREGVQSSIRLHLGLASDRRAGPAEAGIAEMIVDLYRDIPLALDHERLFAWHRMVTNGRRDLADIGCYRQHGEPMQIVSGAIHKPRVHFEAPPSERVPGEMERFLGWFRETAPEGSHPLPAVTRAGIAHLWFESIHPFEDGNGRIGRAIAEMALAQGSTRPNCTGIAGAILKRRKEYLPALELASRDLEATSWLLWFARAGIEAQRQTLARMHLTLNKSRLLADAEGHLNDRQKKALHRMLDGGPEGFAGGISAGWYTNLTGAAPATATRDLGLLVELGVLTRTGKCKATRYHLPFPVEAIEP